LRLIFSVLTAIVVIAAAIFFVGPLFISTDDVRNQLFAQVEAATGYRLRVSGPVDVTLFPSLDLVAEDVGIAQPASGTDAEFATAKKLRFGLMLRGLLDGNVRMTEVTLVDPVIAVPQAKTVAAPGATVGEQAAPGSGGQSVAETLKRLSLDSLVIENGTLILPASGEAKGKRIEQLNLEASLPAFDKPLTFDAGAVIDGKAMHAAGSIGSFGQFLEGAAVPVSLTFEAPAYLDDKATLAATASYKNDTLALSQFTAKSGDKTLAGTAVYKDETLILSQFTATSGKDSFAGNASYKGNTLTVNPLRANVRGTILAGSLSADLSNKVPYVVASLAAKTLNINALTGTPVSSGGGAAGGGGSAAAGWSDAPIDFSPLRKINGKFGVSAEQLVYNDIKISPVAIQATLSGGKLNATLGNFGLYKGAGSANLAVDASGKTPAQRVQMSLANFAARPFLIDTAGFQSIEGNGAITLDLSASGASQRAMVSGLNGTAKLEFTNGAIRGINIAKMLRNLGTGVVTGWQGGEAEKTDFASLGASFTVAQGQATTQDLHLAGPLVRMTGTGTVNLPARQLKFRVDPQLVATLEGQGGASDLQGLGVPVIIEGPWSKPKFYPDIKGILENPVAAYEKLKQFGGGLAKLPGLDKTGALPNIIQDGKINKDALKEGALDSIGALLNKDQPQQQQGGPPVEQQGNAANPPALIQDGKINKDALKQGLGALLGVQQPAEQAAPQQAAPPQAAPPPVPPAEVAPAEAAPAPAPTAQAAPAPAPAPLTKKEKKKKNKEQAEEAAKQLLQNLFGN
jgi:AsmA protein